MIKNMKALRSKYKISQAQLADAIGVSQQSVNKYENSSVEPDIETLIKIADRFSVSVDYLIGHTGQSDSFLSLSADEKETLVGYRFLNEKEKEIIKMIIENHK